MQVLKPLPYDMGNAGDLLKHGVIAEFAEWACRAFGRSLAFLDPFGGRPWAEPPNPRVADRLRRLSDCALKRAQPHYERRYYGSGHVFRHAASRFGCSTRVLASDRGADSRAELTASGLEELSALGFDSRNAYSILTADVSGDLLLIDPFSDFLPLAPTYLPELARVAQSIPVTLFVLDRDPNNRVGRQYADLRSRYLADAFCVRCPKLARSGVRGEAKYEAEVILFATNLEAHPEYPTLRRSLSQFVEHLSGVLGIPLSNPQGS